MKNLKFGQQLGAGGGTTLVYDTMPVDGEIYGIYVSIYDGDAATHTLQLGQDAAGGADLVSSLKDNVIFAWFDDFVYNLDLWLPIELKVNAGTVFTGTIEGAAGSVYQQLFILYYR